MTKVISTGDSVLGRYKDSEEWVNAEFLKYDKHMEYGQYVCLTWTQDGKIVECFDEIKCQLPYEIIFDDQQ